MAVPADKLVTLNVTMRSPNYSAVISKWEGASAHPYLIANKSTNHFTVYQYQGDFAAKIDWLVIGM